MQHVVFAESKALTGESIPRFCLRERQSVVNSDKL